MPSPAASRPLPCRLLLTLCLAGACGDDGGGSASSGTEGGSAGSSGSTSAGSAGSSGSTSAGSAGSGSSTSTSAGTSTSTSTSGSTSGSSSGGTAGACESVVVTYDLTGSVIQIDALVDFTITVQEPYDDDLNTGPGTMKIRFQDDGNGMPAPGTAQIIDYSLVQNYVTGSAGLATVTTDLLTTSGPDGCGTAEGEFDGTALKWSAPAQMDPYCRDGTVSCVGAFCGQGGSPPENMPFMFDNDCTEPHPLNDFTFANGVDNFSSPPVVISMDNGGTVTMEFKGKAIATDLDPSTPACACP